MVINFTKMHGLGNDFVVINAFEQPLELSGEQLRFLADRRFGVGCDQILMVEAPRSPEVDFRYRIFNADGGEVEQCGNGARCFARFVSDQGLTDKRSIPVETASGNIILSLLDNGEVEVNMGQPIFAPERIPFLAEQQAASYSLQVMTETYEIGAVSMGNPHAVLLVESVEAAEVERLGPLIERHERFPQRVNVGFMQIESLERVRLRVFERGSGETLACGTGACAAVASGIRRGLLARQVVVSLPGGELTIRWSGDDDDLYMTGAAESVFKGRIEL